MGHPKHSWCVILWAALPHGRAHPLPDSLRGRVAHPLRGLQRVGILVLAFFPKNLNTYEASGGIEIENSKAPPFVRRGQRMGHPKHSWCVICGPPSPSHRAPDMALHLSPAAINVKPCPVPGDLEIGRAHV